MRVITAFKEKPFHALISSVTVFFLPPLIQLAITPLAFEIWFKTMRDKPLNAFLYFVFAIAFGLLVSLYLYARNKCLDCSQSDVSLGFGGALVGFALGICPACFSIIAVLLPLSGSILLTAYSPVFTAFSIALIAFSIHRLGGFKKN